MPGLVVDLDGTVYRGDVLIPGAAGALDRLRAAGYRVVFATNKSIARAKDYTEKLTHLGVSSDEGHIVTVNEVLTQHLVNKFGRNATVLVIGEDPLREELTGAGLAVTGTVRDAHAVALGWDRRFDYQKLDAVFQAGLRGTHIAATNPDVTCPVETGEMPDCGAQIAAVEAALGRAVDIVVGKPAATMAQAAVQRLGLPPAECTMVGDRIETDIKMANETGLRSALVLSGVTTPQQASASRWRPDVVCTGLVELADTLLSEAGNAEN